MRRVALFGGSFNPPHLGHVLAAVYARVQAQVDAVWVLPVERHPYAKALISLDYRLELCHAAFAPLGTWIEVRDDERRNVSGYTFDLVSGFIAQYADTTFFLIGGSDTAHDLINWHRGAELARLIHVIAVPRRGQGGDHHPAALPAISSSDIRTRIVAAQPIDELVPPAVAALMHTRRWYSATSPSRV